MSGHILHVVGARPQFVKAAVVLAAAPTPGRHRLLHTGQHYDAQLSEIFFEELGIRGPDHSLGVGSGPHGAQTGAMLVAIERVLLGHPGGVMVVYGDTNSTIAGALAATKLHWPVAHVEAGLRSFDRRMPEEINRIATDHISDLLLCPTRRAVRQLASEGRAGAEFTGDVMLDLARRVAAGPPGAVRAALDAGGGHPALDALPGVARRRGGYALATVHRASNTDDRGALEAILGALGALPWPTLLPLHPRTRAAMSRHGLRAPARVHLIEPAGYQDFAELLAGCALCLTDSGGVQKEACFAGRRCVTLRDTTEWPETLDGGWNQLAGASRSAIVRAAGGPEPSGPAPVEAFGAGHAGRLVAAAVEALG